MGCVHLTDGGRRIARAIRRGGQPRLVPAGIGMLVALGTLAGVLAAVRSGAPGGESHPVGAGHAQVPARSAFNLPKVRPYTGDSPVSPGLALGAGGAPMSKSAVQTIRLGARHPPQVAPLRRTVQASLLIVAPTSLSPKLAAAVSRLPGVTVTEQIEAVRMRISGAYTAVLGVDPSVFRSFAARATGASNALWEGVASGGIAVSYSMGKLDKLPLGGTVVAAGHTTKRLRVVAFGTMGIEGVDGVVSHAVARSLGAPAGNAIVVSVRTENFTAAAAALGRLIPKVASVQQLVSLVTIGPSGSGMAGAGPLTASGAPTAQLNVMLRAAMSRQGMLYIWGAAGPKSFDCSGLVQWSFAQAGIVMPRVAADQALAGPAVPVSKIQPGDLLFYHTDPTAPRYISHVAIYVGNGWMIQAPEPGRNVEVVPADFGAGFAGAIRVNVAQAGAVAGGAA